MCDPPFAGSWLLCAPVVCAVAVLTATTAVAFRDADWSLDDKIEAPFANDALEPFISAATMDVHVNGHWAGYAAKAKAAIAALHDEVRALPPTELLDRLSRGDIDVEDAGASLCLCCCYIFFCLVMFFFSSLFFRFALLTGRLRFFLGGWYYHKLFFSTLAPPTASEEDAAAVGNLTVIKAINHYFSNFAEFKTFFEQQATYVEGSGYTCLVLGDEGSTLAISVASNQDVPDGTMTPLLCIDLWEHAYYLSLKNQRAKYHTTVSGRKNTCTYFCCCVCRWLENWWKVVNWKAVNERFLQYTSVDAVQFEVGGTHGPAVDPATFPDATGGEDMTMLPTDENQGELEQHADEEGVPMDGGEEGAPEEEERVNEEL